MRCSESDASQRNVGAPRPGGGAVGVGLPGPDGRRVASYGLDSSSPGEGGRLWRLTVLLPQRHPDDALTLTAQHPGLGGSSSSLTHAPVSKLAVARSLAFSADSPQPIAENDPGDMIDTMLPSTPAHFLFVTTALNRHCSPDGAGDCLVVDPMHWRMSFQRASSCLARSASDTATHHP